MTATGLLPMLAPLVPAGLLALSLSAAAGIRQGIENRERMTKSIESTLAIHTLGSLWLTGLAIFMIFG